MAIRIEKAVTDNGSDSEARRLRGCVPGKQKRHCLVLRSPQGQCRAGYCMLRSACGAARACAGAGRAGVAPNDVVGILANALLGTGASYSDMATNIVLNVRLPRVVAAPVIGAALSAISGVSIRACSEILWYRLIFWAHRPAHRLAPRWALLWNFRQPCGASHGVYHGLHRRRLTTLQRPQHRTRRKPDSAAGAVRP